EPDRLAVNRSGPTVLFFCSPAPQASPCRDAENSITRTIDHGINSGESAVNVAWQQKPGAFRVRQNRADRTPAGSGETVGRMARGNSEGSRRRTTLSDVATRAGVSAVTASRALRNPDMVSLALRERVTIAVRELAYIPNQLASALA